jgi:nucleoid-associated protein YgaU
MTVLVGVASAYAAATALLAWASAGVLAATAAPGPATLDTVLGLAAAAVAWLVLTWLVLTFTVAVCAAAATGGRQRWRALAQRRSPDLARRLAAAAIGAGLAGAPLLAAGAAAAQTRDPLVVGQVADRPAGRSAGLPTGWSADRPAPPQAPLAAPAPPPPPAPTPPPRTGGTAPDTAGPAREVVVRPGDTLWDLAARALGPGASAAAVAAEWPRWHEANRDRIGPDPHLILPGMHLRPPTR